MTNTGVSNRVLGALVLIAGAALARLIPHPANVTPVIAMALFSGATLGGAGLGLGRKVWALAVPLIAMFVSDLALGLHSQMGAVYGSILLIAVLGFALQKSKKPARVAGASIAASLLFFAITNFTVWTSSGMYPMTSEGLVACYGAALPFLRNAILGDLFFSGVLFGAYALYTQFLAARSSRSAAGQANA